MIQDEYIRKGHVFNVVDGDTIDVDMDLGFYTTIKQRFRLLRINCPEKFGVTKEEGLKAKAFTTEKLIDKTIVFKSVKTDSFKRWLAEVWYTDAAGNEINISDELLAEGLAVEYMIDKA